MAIATVRTPQGIVKVRVPDGASPDEIQAFVQQQLAQQTPEPEPEPAKPPKEKESWYEDLGEGLVSSALDTGYGVKSLFTDLSEEEKARLKDWKDDAAESGWGTAGRVVGELGQLAVPGGIGLKAARALNAANKLRKTAKMLPMASDVAGTAAHSYAQVPREDISREAAALYGGSAALGGGVLGKALAPLVRGVKGTAATERLRDAGAKLTPGMMKPNSLGGAENFAEYLVPSLSRAIQKRKAEAAESVKGVVLKKAAPPTPETVMKAKPVKYEPTKTGWEGVEQLQKAFDDGYTAAWKNADDISIKMVDDVDQVAKEAIEDLPEAHASVMKRLMRDIDKLKETGKATPKDLDRIIRQRIQRGRTTGDDSYELNQALFGMRSALRNNTPAATQKALKRLDDKWKELLTIQKASGYKGAALKRGDFNQKDLMGASKAYTPDAKFARGQGPFQREAADWDEAIGDPAGMLMSASRRFVQKFPSLIPGNKSASNLVAGNYATQKELRKLLQTDMADKLRYTMSTARLGGAYEDL